MKKRKPITPHEAQRLAAAGAIEVILESKLIDIVNAPYEFTKEERRLIWNERDRIVGMLRELRGPRIKWPEQPKCPKCSKLADEKCRYPTSMDYSGQKWEYHPCGHVLWGCSTEEPWPPEDPDSFQTIPAGYDG